MQNKMTDKSKRAMKKRHANLLGGQQPSNRVNKYLAQAIEARSMGQEKSNHVHALSLCFRDSSKEHLVSYFLVAHYLIVLLKTLLRATTLKDRDGSIADTLINCFDLFVYLSFRY